ncbi:MAG: hypothetical protein MUE36_00820 [Acidimicrobiales bacterium]|nr:hypothetical protein [Acidimicrobiales bacterium]
MREGHAPRSEEATTMKNTLRNTVVAGTVAAALLASGGVAVAQSATTADQPAATAAGSRSTEREARRAERTADLAERLGVTAEQVTAAREAARAAVEAQFGPRPERPTTPPTAEERAAREATREAARALFDQTFAAELGVSVEQVQAAREAGLQEHLAEKVADGTLTQEEADARLESFRNGEHPVGRGERGGHRPGPGVGAPTAR